MIETIIFAVIAFFVGRFLTAQDENKSEKFFNEKQVVTLIQNKYSVFALGFSRPVGLDKETIMAIIAQESGGQPDAIGGIGERGLMQITQGALHDVNRNFSSTFTFDDMFEPAKNIKAGTFYLSWLWNQFSGNLDLAIQAYNAGIGNVRKNNERGTLYLNKIKRWRKLF